MSAVPTPDADGSKGAVEQDSRDQETNTTMRGQMQHRNKSPMADTLDSDFPEPGMSPEHTGQNDGADRQGSRQWNSDPERNNDRAEGEPREQNPEGQHQDQDPGERQKRNQGDKKDDSLAA